MSILKRGSQGSEVERLQASLSLVGAFTGAVDGIFGLLTEEAVKRFQKRTGLYVDGLVGDRTWAALDAAGAAESGAQHHHTRAVVLESGLAGRLVHRTGTPWMDEALKFSGYKEIPGEEDNPEIVSLWAQGRISWQATDDETPWCAVAVSAALENAGVRSTRSAWARSYETWGTEVAAPVYGAIAVFWRGDGPDDAGREWPRGHVGFLTAMSEDRATVRIFGGNQGNEMKEASFSTEKLLTLRWPPGFDVPEVSAATDAGVAGEQSWV